MKAITAILATLILIVGCSQAPKEHISITDQLEELQTKDGKPQLEQKEIALLRATGAGFEAIDHLLSMKDDRSQNLFKPTDVAWFLRCGGTVEYAESLASLRSEGGRQYFYYGHNIAHLKAIGAGEDVVLSLANMRTRQDQPLFDGPIIIQYLEQGGDTLFARKVLDLFDAHDVNPRSFMWHYNKYRMSLDDLEFYLGIEHLQMWTLKRFIEDGGTREYASTLLDAGIEFRWIQRLNALRVPTGMITEYKYTERPNALFLFSYADYNNEFTSDAALELFHKIWQAYDTQIVFIEQEGQIAEAFDEMNEVELLAFCGHGNAESIEFRDMSNFSGLFSSEVLAEKARKKNADKGFLDTTDTEFEALFAKMPEDGVIFLDACETNRPTKSGRNLYQFIQSIAGGRRVIGAETIFSHEQIVLKNAYPLEIEFLPPPPKEESDPRILDKSKTFKQLREKKKTERH